MTGRVAGKVALVTGGGSGIGRATAELLAREGATVVLTDLDAEGGEGVAEEIRRANGSARFRVQDVTGEADWDATMDDVLAAHGRLDIVVNNAGVGSTGKPVHETTLEEWRRTFAVNVEGVFLGTRAGIRAMRATGTAGSIVNISSIYGLVGAVGTSPYNASKGAVRLFTKCAALECAQDGTGIRVNSIHPGHIETPMITFRIATPELRRKLTAKYPVGHLGEPFDIASGILFLASDESKFMTGAELVIDGGFTAQ